MLGGGSVSVPGTRPVPDTHAYILTLGGLDRFSERGRAVTQVCDFLPPNPLIASDSDG